ncbi:peptidase s8 and s53 subtilisin kexin sedolisin [Colletotrichum plurivorum]|uniref:Peptidase s8 and s53 subtilisin kexin sedolisin n=1 Tax=Colletotrichum plurivorum TaxID=2175906 RepID=A0A8H6MYA0_9PEZI|nr:peptidase s8 and s53 subtilisin kexin sedolisin [Colletotrichum plurivorum]
MRRTILSATLFGAAAIAGMELDRRQSGQSIPLSPDFEFLLGIVGGIGGPSSSAGISTSAPLSTSGASTVPTSSLSSSAFFGNSTSQTTSRSTSASSTSVSVTLSSSSSASSSSVSSSSDTASTTQTSSSSGSSTATSTPSSSQSSSSQSSSSQSSSSQSSSSQSSSSSSSPSSSSATATSTSSSPSSQSSSSSSSTGVSSTSSSSSSSSLSSSSSSSSSSSLISSSSTITTTSSSSSSSSTAPAFTGCNFNIRPPVRLQNPTKLVFNNYDTGFAVINVPFQVGLYGTTDTTIYVHINGLISLFTTTTDNQARAVPNTAGNIPPVSILPYNTDLTIPDIDQWGVYFEVRPSTRFTGRELVVEYIVSSNGADYIHFSTTFYEASTGRSRFEYYQSRLKGADASVGIQNLQISPQRSAQWSFMGAFTQDNFFVEYNAPNSVGDSLSTGQVSNPATSC